MIGKRTFNDFNRESTTLVISRYPEKNMGKESTDGISWYTKRTVLTQSKKYKTRFVILAEKGMSNRPRLFGDGKVLVLRVFDKKHPGLFPQILKWLRIFSKIKKVIVHSEFCADGGGRNILLLLPFLTLIKLSGKNITFFSHNVVEDFDDISEHLNLKKKSLKLKIFNRGIKLYNSILGKVVDKVVVLDKALEERIKKFVNIKKIICTNIWIIKAQDKISKEIARKKLGYKNNEKVILCFGFVSWYKGTDWLIKEFDKYIRKNKNEKIRLVVAGGKSYSLKDKKYYKKYFQGLDSIANKNSKISITGFVLDENIKYYFRACDLLVLPYRGLIGASGTLNHGLSFGKAFMLSSKMARALDNKQIIDKYKKLKIEKRCNIFAHSQIGMKKIIKTLRDNDKLKELEYLSSEVAKIYRFNNCIKNEYNEIYGDVTKQYKKENCGPNLQLSKVIG